MKITLTPEQVEIITELSEGSEENGISIVEEGFWIQGYKYQTRNIIFKFEDKFWKFTETRAGSPFTDWDYCGNNEAVQVEPVEVVKVVWEPVEENN